CIGEVCLAAIPTISQLYHHYEIFQGPPGYPSVLPCCGLCADLLRSCCGLPAPVGQQYRNRRATRGQQDRNEGATRPQQKGTSKATRPESGRTKRATTCNQHLKNLYITSYIIFHEGQQGGNRGATTRRTCGLSMPYNAIQSQVKPHEATYPISKQHAPSQRHMMPRVPNPVIIRIF